MTTDRMLSIALVAIGAVMVLLYPLALVWPAGWSWHAGPPEQSDYFMMIVGVYATLGVFLIRAARNPMASLSLIWFTIVSSVVHGVIMSVQSFTSPHQMGHLMGDVPALLLAAVVLTALLVVRERRQ